MFTLFQNMKREWSTILRSERLFIIAAMLCSFCIMFEYSITKPTSNSIFISTYGVTFFPYAWLCLVPINLAIVAFYNRFFSRFGCMRAQLLLCLATTFINIFCAFFIQKIYWLAFLHYIWKDIYVLLLFQQLWSVIHSTIKTSRVKYLYGILFGVGGMGAALGSLIPGFLAVKMGSPFLFLLTVPFYLILAVAYFFLVKHSKQVPDSQPFHTSMTSRGFSLIRDSRFLQFILLIVILMQWGTTLVEYQFNSYLEAAFPQRDFRTEYIGRLFGVVNSINIAFQLIGSYLLVRWLGLRKSHLLIPGILTVNAFSFLIFPTLSLITFCYGTVKSFEYSLFNILKEMLYNPLRVEEKSQAKAVIDVFAYRGSKALASLFVLGVQFTSFQYIKFSLSLGVFLLFLAWLLIVRKILFKADLRAFQTANMH